MGHVLQMRNKVLEFSFLPQGSIKGQKMTFFVKLFSQELYLHFIE